ncbi:primosomal protein DnaI [Fictibacillus barbaricus]|uniref:Primosomal protein DnaI n=1 Tax=Fictibacillus barbaricus TaxID=182136 RepID=A0ABU1U2U4_9BACL|nr:primosomal protein DnaI [Fictibacillus barbaricus]MDR7073745.1 primosomal protein DnaI [Fictibacillus barbaricus]
MESIKESVKNMPGFNKFQEKYELMKQQVLTDPNVMRFLRENPDISDVQAEKLLSNFYTYRNEQLACSNCPGLENCPNLMKGYRSELTKVRQTVELRYKPCELKMIDDQKKSMSSLIKSYFIPKEILDARFERLYNPNMDEARSIAIQKAYEFVQTAGAGQKSKGIYFYGKFGVGKTYLLGAIANGLAEKGIHSLMIHTPEFLREMKQSLSDGSFDSKMKLLKTVPVLMLDDIGAENMTNWVRDEILGVILQYRMMERLPTLYTSNCDYDMLQQHLSFSQKGGLDEVKALRIMERIKHSSHAVFMGGSKNFREDF